MTYLSDKDVEEEFGRLPIFSNGKEVFGTDRFGDKYTEGISVDVNLDAIKSFIHTIRAKDREAFKKESLEFFEGMLEEATIAQERVFIHEMREQIRHLKYGTHHPNYGKPLLHSLDNLSKE